MHCPFCSHGETQVMETRLAETGDSIRRRRRCASCDRRFTTYERIELSMPAVVKSDGSRVDYDREKLEFSMRLALRKRPVSKEAFEGALDHVENRLFRLGLKEVPSATIGELVMDELRKLDKVAYIRFASVYRKFEDIEAFADAINEIRPSDALADIRRQEATVAPGAARDRAATVDAGAPAVKPRHPGKLHDA